MRLKLSDWVRPLTEGSCDLLVVGGGATGLGVALQAALEGRKVALLEGRDFACGTSSRSTKLLHGGVRYLAQGRVGLVREALRERATVLKLAPHLAQPLPFVVAEKNRLSWLLTWTGLKLYELLAGRLSLGPTQAIGRTTMKGLLPSLTGTVAGVRYWDGQFEDARLALALARTAQASGGWIRNHTRVVGLQPTAEGWTVSLQDSLNGDTATVHARCVVNAAGVWVDAIRQLALKASFAAAGPKSLVCPSQGVHIVVSRQKLNLAQAVLVPRTSDGRVLFAIPWMGATVIGTTDTPRVDTPLEPRPTDEELRFLFDETRRSLGVTLTPEDVQSVWVGLRPLVSAASVTDEATTQSAALSREHLVVREAPGFVTVTGGKWTTYRVMAEEVMATLQETRDLPSATKRAFTAQHRLWGAPAIGAPEVNLRAAPGLHLLGTAANDVAALPGHHQHLGLGLTESVVRYGARHEWAVTVEDVLARRWRALFLDARAAKAMAPRVAEVLLEETGQDPQLDAFLRLCDLYLLR